MRKLEGLLHCNRYNDIAFRKKAMSQLEDPNPNKIMSSTTGFRGPQK